jgi:hypothetical protein
MWVEALLLLLPVSVFAIYWCAIAVIVNFSPDLAPLNPSTMAVVALALTSLTCG